MEILRDITQPLAIIGGMAARRRTINGDMRIDQANAGAAASCATGSPVYSVDKWLGVGKVAGGVFSMQQQAGGPNGFANFVRITATTASGAPAASDAYAFCHRIEGLLCQDLQFGVAANGQYVTLGFWVRSSLTGTFSGALGNNATNRSYPFSFSIPVANTWTFITEVIPVDTTGTWLITSGIGLRVSFDLGCGSNFKGADGAWNANFNFGVTGAVGLMATLNATLDITGVQLEPGTAATTYEQRAFGDELRLCEREYCKTFPLGTAPATNTGTQIGALAYSALAAGVVKNSVMWRFPSRMRAQPTVNFYNPNAANSNWRNRTTPADSGASSTGGSGAPDESMCVVANAQVAGDAIGNDILIHVTADARL